MKTRRHNLERGGVLVATLIFCGLVGIMLAAYLAMVSGQHKFSQRSQVWNNCIPMCEAGVEEALAHLNHIGTTSNFAINGWTFSSGSYRKERYLNGGLSRMAVDTNMPPTITVVSSLQSPVQSGSLTRRIRVKTRYNQKFAYGVLSKGAVDMGGNGFVDSFNSEIPAESSPTGQYTASNATDRASVVTASKLPGQLSIGNGTIFGSVATGPGGSVTIGSGGNVGTETWNNNPANDGKIEPGHNTDDVNVYIPNGALPIPFGPVLPAGPGLVGTTNYNYVFGNGDYRVMTDINLGGGGKIIVTGRARVHVLGATRFTSDAYVLIGNNASIEWYSTRDWDMGGAGVVNGTGLAKNFSLIGLPTCLNVKYSGTSKFVGSVYAPSADIIMTGTAEAIGAWVGKTFKISGTMDVHYDEALKGNPNEGRFIAASWQEL